MTPMTISNAAYVNYRATIGSGFNKRDLNSVAFENAEVRARN